MKGIKCKKGDVGLKDDSFDNKYDETYHVEQGVMVPYCVVLDNQQERNISERTGTKFLSLDTIQRGMNVARPYFPVETMHHTHEWRHKSSLVDQALTPFSFRGITLDCYFLMIL